MGVGEASRTDITTTTKLDIKCIRCVSRELGREKLKEKTI